MNQREKTVLTIVGGVVIIALFFIYEEGDNLADGIGAAFKTFVDDFWQFLLIVAIVAGLILL